MSDNTNTNTIIINGVEFHECEHCSQLVPVDQLHDVKVYGGSDYGSHEMWCDDCVESDAHKCECCGELVDTTDEVRVGYVGRIEDWCPDCVEDGAFYCEHCGDLHDNDHAHEVIVNQNWGRSNDTEMWCEDCVESDAHECNDCGELFSDSCDEFREYSTWDGDYVYLCESCRDDNWTWCENCDELVNLNDAYWSEHREGYYCPNCHRDSALQSYGHTTGTVFWQDDGTKMTDYEAVRNGRDKILYLGVELETDYNDDCYELANDIVSALPDDSVECKHDGSLEDNGVEIVSLPMTPLWQLNGGVWDTVTRITREHGGTSHDAGTCGLHIHMSRAFFNDHDAVYRLDRLFHRFRNQMVKFSRRTPNQLGHWCRLGDEHDDLVKIKDICARKEEWADKKRWAGRYECVNDTNHATVEIRLWRGTLNMQTLRATIEFTTGLALVVNSMSDEYADELTWDTLKTIVRYALEAEGIPYEDLDAYLKLRDL